MSTYTHAIEDTAARWPLLVRPRLDADCIEALIEDRAAAVIVPDFIDAGRLDEAVAGVYREGFTYYSGVEPPIGRIGEAAVQYFGRSEGKVSYFRSAEPAHLARARAFERSGDLLDDLLEALRSAWGPGAEVAVDASEGKRYFAGIIRLIGSAGLHVDWAPWDAPGWTIGGIEEQLTANLFLQCGGGGETVVYRRRWTRECEAHKRTDNYGYDPMPLVTGVEFARIPPIRGALVLFDPRHFHEVRPASPGVDRITFSAFIGMLGDSREMVLWS